MLSVLVINCVPMPNARKVCVVFWHNSRKGCVLWRTKPERRSYRTEIGLLKNEDGMRQSLENVVPW